MSIRHGLLALLLEGPAYGNQLRARFEQRTGGSWPLNIGQVFQTLDRLVRDGLVAPTASGTASPPQARTCYELTAAGRESAAGWFAQPVSHDWAPRDELAIKVSLALTTPGVKVGEVLAVERHATMAALQELTAIKRRRLAADPACTRQPWMLILDRVIFDTEARLRWLDHCRDLHEPARSIPARPQPTGG